MDARASREANCVEKHRIGNNMGLKSPPIVTNCPYTFNEIRELCEILFWRRERDCRRTFSGLEFRYLVSCRKNSNGFST